MTVQADFSRRSVAVQRQRQSCALRCGLPLEQLPGLPIQLALAQTVHISVWALRCQS